MLPHQAWLQRILNVATQFSVGYYGVLWIEIGGRWHVYYEDVNVFVVA